jgi:hypothetical protein
MQKQNLMENVRFLKIVKSVTRARKQYSHNFIVFSVFCRDDKKKKCRSIDLKIIGKVVNFRNHYWRLFQNVYFKSTKMQCKVCNPQRNVQKFRVADPHGPCNTGALTNFARYEISSRSAPGPGGTYISVLL